ncbi:MAG: alanine racemase [Lachnospiraceae bacterium]|nr:alanine racemase [Lachnospiraceae bacterium]
MFGNERVYAAINLDHLRNNIEEISKNISETTGIMAVIKTDGYGHGAIPIAAELEALPKVTGYGVATIEEAMALKRSGCKKPVLILGYSFPSAYDAIVEQDIRATVFEYESAAELSKIASQKGKTAKIHLKVDTGMNRIGMRPDESGILVTKKIVKLPGIEIEGIFTHFAKADESDKTGVNAQISKFNAFLKALEDEGIDIPIKHCSNSAGIIDIPSCNMNMVRAGIILYGLWPSDEVNKESISLKPMMELKSTVVFVKEVDEGNEISYGGTFVTGRKTKIATVSVGYGDGYPRILSNVGYVLIHGKKAPIVGRVCMDQMMVDVTEIPLVKQGDTVTLIGVDGDEEISMDDFSKLSMRINYESVCDIGKRVPRIYFKNGKEVLVNQPV